MEYDLHSNCKAVKALSHAAITTNTTTNGDIIDTAGFESIEFVLLTATVTDGTFSVVLKEGNNSGFSDAATIASTGVIGALPAIDATDDNKVFRVGTVSKKRYVRLQVVSTGVTSGGSMGAVALLSNPASKPVADQST